MKVQQAQLIKDNKTLEALIERLGAIVPLLEEKVLLAKQVIENNANVPDAEIQEWNNRLGNRVTDIETTKIVSMQTRAQMEIMIKNNICLIDALQNAIGITIPLWKNQVIMLLGDEMLAQNHDKTRNVIKSTHRTIGVVEKQLKKKKVSSEERDKLETSNIKLLADIQNLFELESERNEIVSNLELALQK